MDGLTLQLGEAGVLVVLAALSLALVHFLTRRGLLALQSWQQVDRARRQQLITLLYTLKWIANVLILIVSALMLLSVFGVNIAPLLASAGLTGLALGLGGQSLLRDLIGGVLVLVEDQYVIGDSIEIGNVSGQVERITLRVTYIRAANGDLYLVPNGEVRVVGNRTRDWSAVLVDLGVAYEEDLDQAIAVLEESAAAFAQHPEYGPQLLEPPQVLGVVGLGDWAVSVRVRAKVQPGQQWQVGREMRKFLLAACAREGLSLPYPRQEVWVRSTEWQTPEGAE